ncbi:MAG TPA: hypothetical protein DCS07_16415 [Bdellovibrionales bacterium]|nr:MAG: hypothetical protein A2X97_12230 [Bdellovibrionales bacterium GWA1_52_35]OFZ39764.1 MAG: hypothetical protein A2070_01070 [Bdellovibrionales bacterium GWC1_52_8]HAR44189.1 hypothetical protein [Bdellovibrionales bacterium]HCM41601.1 hypothetical protein [Bdellovibrionales bacterium]
MKKLLIVACLSGVLSTIPASASRIPTIHCQVLDSNGVAFQEPIGFTAHSRSSHSLRVTKQGILSFRWGYYKSPLEITMEHNPHYPFTIPFTVKTLGKIKMRPGDDGLIRGVVAIDPILEGFQLSCEESD